MAMVISAAAGTALGPHLPLVRLALGILISLLCTLRISSASAAESIADGDVCASSNDAACRAPPSPKGRRRPPVGRPLRPSDLPKPVVFTAFDGNATVTLPGGERQRVKSGTLTQINNFENPSRDDVLADLAVLPSAVNRSSVEELLRLLRNYSDWDDDPDTVDGMPSYEMFVHSPDLDEKSADTTKFRDVDPRFLPARRALRRKLTDIMRPYLDGVLTPMVHMRYPDACTSKGPSRRCTPCYSLVRRYRHGQRQSHATHHDGHAIVTVVVSLSDYSVDYTGGLHVSTGHGQYEYMGLDKGDAVMHQSSLLHGVKVYDARGDPARTERWSWILWFRDSETCEDHGHEWFAECARGGDPLCQQFHSTKVGAVPGISEEETAKQVLELNVQAAKGGAGMAAVKVARAYLGQLPSSLPFEPNKAAEYYRMAIRSHNPDGHYGTAQLLLMGTVAEHADDPGRAWQDPRVASAVDHLEEAAYLGHAFAAFNLGVVHAFGYGRAGDGVDADLAGRWFEECGLPEGYAAAGQQAAAAGNAAREREMMERARALGFFAPWRARARQTTGSGGASGVDLNLPWPPARDGRRPPKF